MTIDSPGSPGSPGSPPPNTSWSAQQVRQLLDTEDLSYQRIELPYGLATDGDDRSATCERILPTDLSDISVLDVGCQIGYFCFEAARRGSPRVLGIDVDDDTIRKARLLADCLGRAPEFRVLDLERETIEESFDYVLCLNVLHHFKNPLAALEKLAAITRRCLVLELVGFGRHDRKKLGAVSWLSTLLLRRHPVLYAGRTGISGRYYSPKFVIAPRAITHILTVHRNEFARVDSRPSPFKDRYIAVAYKRRVKHLVLVAGPPSSGKSHLIRALQRGQWPELAGQLGLADAADWPKIEARRLHRINEPVLDRLLMHYNFLSPFHRSAHSYERDEALDILRLADRLSIITVWTSPPVLLERFEQAKAKGLLIGDGHMGSRRLLQIREQYRDRATVIRFYERWFDFALPRAASHHVVCTDGDPTLCDVDQWKALVSACNPLPVE